MTKSECRNPKEIRMTKSKDSGLIMVRPFGHSSFDIVSSLVIRASSFALLLACLGVISYARADDLPRKSKTARENYPNVEVIYDSVTTPHGERLRTIVTKPRGAKAKLPVIFVAGWLSCDSVEAPADTKDASGLVF